MGVYMGINVGINVGAYIYIYIYILKMPIIIVWSHSPSFHNYPCVVRIPMILAISSFALDTVMCHARDAAQRRAPPRLCARHQEEVHICAARRRVCTDVGPLVARNLGCV